MLVISPLGEEATSWRAVLAGSAVAVLLLHVAQRVLFPRSRAALVVTDKDGNRIPLRKIHVPKSTLPVFGNLVETIIQGPRILHWVVEQSLEFNNEPWMRRIPGQPEMITFSSPEAMEELTTTQFENFEKGAFQIDLVRALFGRGLVASDGERWYHQRKAAVKFFTARSLRAFMTRSMHKNIDQVCAVLDAGRESGTLVDLKTLFHEFTLQTFVELGLGLKLDWIGAKEPHPFQEAIDAASPLISRRFRRPSWAWKLERWLNIGPEATLARSMKIVYSWLHETVQASLEASVNKPSNNTEEDIKSVVELFVQSSRDDADGIRSEDLVDFLLTFVVAARDTTAVTLSWLFYALSKHPHVEQALRDEMTSKLPALSGDKSAYLTTEQTKGLTYMEATIKEALRLYPAATTTVKQVVRDTVICGDIPLYKGQICLLSAYAMARNPRVWGPDAAEFKPERWIDPETGNLIQVPASKFFTFHAGPRTCIGMNLAMLELRIVVANLLHRFRFDIDPSNDGSYVPAPTLVMKHPLFARVRAV